MTSPIRAFAAGAMQVQVFSSKREASQVAAAAAAEILRDAIANRGRARMVVSTGNSQLDFIDALVLARDLDWTPLKPSTSTSMPAWRRRTRRASGSG